LKVPPEGFTAFSGDDELAAERDLKKLSAK
jgi:hypothetical protein